MHFPYNSQSTQKSSSCASNAYDDRERERKQKFQTRLTFSLTKGKVLFDFGPKILFSTMLVCLSFPPQQEEKEKNFVERERETWQQKKERDFRFSLKRHAHTNKTRIITHHNRSSFFSAIFNDTFLRHHFSFQRYSDKRNNVVSFCSFFSRRGLHVFVVAS